MRKFDLIKQVYGGCLYNRENHFYITLNKSATLILTYISELKSVEKAKEKFIALFQGADKNIIIRDFDNFISSLKDTNIELEDIFNLDILGSFDKLSIIEAELELLQKCEFACKYCVINGSPNGDPGLDVKSWLKIVKWLISNNLRACTITGGDPMLSEAFWPVLELLAEKDITITINTTGAMIDKDFIEKISKFKNKNNISFQISLDSTEREVNDYYRGVGAFDTSLKAIKILRSYGFNVVISCIIFKEPKKRMDEMIKFASKYGCKVRFGELDYVGRAKKLLKKEDVLLTQEDKAELNKYLVDLKFTKPEMFNEKMIINSKDESERYIQDGKRKCPLAFGTIDIYFDGTIKPCSLPKDYFESIDKDYVSLNALDEPDLTNSNMYKKISNIQVDPNKDNSSCALGQLNPKLI